MIIIIIIIIITTTTTTTTTATISAKPLAQRPKNRGSVPTSPSRFATDSPSWR